MISYDKKYFDWQKEIGIFGGIVNKFKFEKHIEPKDTLVDFGSGGGYLLKNLNCKQKLGIEINYLARKESNKNRIKAVKNINQVKNNYADKIISNHALEHVINPLETLKKLRPKLKMGGKILFVVPHDNVGNNYDPNDLNQHLYTWNCQSLGNLFKEAGYKNIKTYNIRHKWPPHYFRIYSIFGEKKFNIICKIYATLNNNYQVKVIAQK